MLRRRRRAAEPRPHRRPAAQPHPVPAGLGRARDTNVVVKGYRQRQESAHANPARRLHGAARRGAALPQALAVAAVAAAAAAARAAAAAVAAGRAAAAVLAAAAARRSTRPRRLHRRHRRLFAAQLDGALPRAARPRATAVARRRPRHDGEAAAIVVRRRRRRALAAQLPPPRRALHALRYCDPRQRPCARRRVRTRRHSGVRMRAPPLPLRRSARSHASLACRLRSRISTRASPRWTPT